MTQKYSRFLIEIKSNPQYVMQLLVFGNKSDNLFDCPFSSRIQVVVLLATTQNIFVCWIGNL